MSFIDDLRKTSTTIGNIVKETYGPLSALEQGSASGTIYRYPLDVGNSQRYPHTIHFQTWIPETSEISDMKLFGEIKEIGSLVGAKAQAMFDNVVGAPKRLLNKVADDTKRILGDQGAAPEFSEDLQAQIRAQMNESIDNLNIDVPVGDYTGYVIGSGGSTMRVNQNQAFNNRITDWTRRASPGETIAMYMPAGGWMDRISNAYQQQSMTAAMGNWGAVLEVASGVIQEWKNSGGEAGWEKAMDTLKGAGGVEAAAKIGGGMLGMDTGVLTDAGLNSMGYALNPQFEMLYSGTDLREFQFDFIMTPRNEKEAKVIQNIIKLFKYHASPAYVPGGMGRYIMPPSYFDITFMYNGAQSDWLPKISTCVLKSFDVDYTGGLEQWATHADGSPIQVKMTMIFAELEMMHKALRKEGY